MFVHFEDSFQCLSWNSTLVYMYCQATCNSEIMNWRPSWKPSFFKFFKMLNDASLESSDSSIKPNTINYTTQCLAMFWIDRTISSDYKYNTTYYNITIDIRFVKCHRSTISIQCFYNQLPPLVSIIVIQRIVFLISPICKQPGVCT